MSKSTTRLARSMRYLPSFNTTTINEEFNQNLTSMTTNAKQTFPIPFLPNWTYYPIDYQMSLDEHLQFFMEKQTQPPVVPKVSKIVKQETQS
ncbi:unnamed protein product [Brassica oleracea]